MSRKLTVGLLSLLLLTSSCVEKSKDKNKKAVHRADFSDNTDSESDKAVSSADQCTHGYRRSSKLWAPGLPNPPASQRICTNGTVGDLNKGEEFNCSGSSRKVFTDSRQDGLMAEVVQRFHAVPENMKSRDLALRIRDVKVDVRNQQAVVRVVLAAADGNYQAIDLDGVLEGDKAKLESSSRFAGVLTCVDADQSCQNVILRLQQLNEAGKTRQVAYVVHREGPAYVTISEQDEQGFREIADPAHGQFAEYLSNTSYNSCVMTLREVYSAGRKLGKCTLERLKNQCGANADPRFPAARSFDFRSWAVAYGRAGFEFAMVDDNGVSFHVQGPLVAGSEVPVWPRPLRVEGSLGSMIERAVLVANDGGGNLNLQIDFQGQQNSHTRISITTMIENSRSSGEQLVQKARQNPEEAVPPAAEEKSEEAVEEKAAPAPRKTENRKDTPVTAREEDDNQTIQPSDLTDGPEDLGAEGPE